jgi:hypothetical protein
VLRVAFLHVGQDTTLPRILVRSIRQFNIDAHVTQCTDRTTPDVPGVDAVERLEADTSRLMTFRLRSFAVLQVREPTLFLDTDMVCADRIDAAADVSDVDVSVCVREFNKDGLFNSRFMNMDFSEYEGRTLNEVYPYLACAVIAKNPEFWSLCLNNLIGLPDKFHRWFGDQEAMRNVIAAGGRSVGALRESRYACPPNAIADPGHRPKFFHFKGPTLKQSMIDAAREAGWLDDASASSQQQG